MAQQQPSGSVNLSDQLTTTLRAIQTDITTLQAAITDSLLIGDRIAGQAANTQMMEQVRNHHEDLKQRESALTKKISEGQGLIERANRDFIDTKATVSEDSLKDPKAVHVIEDYTVAVLLVAYLFLVCVMIYLHVQSAVISKLVAFGQALVVAAFGSFLVGLLMYYLV